MIIHSDYLIFGLSAAGLHAAQTIRQLDAQATITAIDSLPISYNKCFFTSLNSGYKNLNDLLLRTDDWFTEQRINRYQTTITSIDPHASIAIDNFGNQYHYKKLLLAVGTKPRNFHSNPRILNYHTIDDVLHLQGVFTHHKPKTALDIGGGFNGIEIAQLLHKHQISVTLLEQSSHLLSNNLSPQAYGWLLSYASQRMNIHFNRQIERIGVSADQVVAYAVSAEYAADILVDCRGIQPNTSWLPSEITRDRKNYILVNDQQQTSIPNVYAAGDCSVPRNEQHYSHLWINAAVEGIYTGHCMVGKLYKKPARFIGGETKFPDFPVYCRGAFSPEFTQIIEKTDEYYSEKWLDNGQKLRGFVLIGTLKGAGELTQRFLRD
jgi:NAD(P)H-nitrite reductase large subunit